MNTATCRCGRAIVHPRKHTLPPSFLNDPARRWRVRVFDLDPILRSSSRPIRPIAGLGDDTFEPHGAGVLEDRLALGAGKMLGQSDAVRAGW